MGLLLITGSRPVWGCKFPANRNGSAFADGRSAIPGIVAPIANGYGLVGSKRMQLIYVIETAHGGAAA